MRNFQEWLTEAAKNDKFNDYWVEAVTNQCWIDYNRKNNKQKKQHSLLELAGIKVEEEAWDQDNNLIIKVTQDDEFTLFKIECYYQSYEGMVVDEPFVLKEVVPQQVFVTHYKEV